MLSLRQLGVENLVVGALRRCTHLARSNFLVFHGKKARVWLLFTTTYRQSSSKMVVSEMILRPRRRESENSIENVKNAAHGDDDIGQEENITHHETMNVHPHE